MHNPEEEHVIPTWADGFGWALVVVAVLQLPIWAAVAVYKARGATLKEVKGGKEKFTVPLKS